MDKTITLLLPNGSTVELLYTAAFLQNVKKAFCITNDADVTHDMLKEYLANELHSAINDSASA